MEKKRLVEREFNPWTSKLWLPMLANFIVRKFRQKLVLGKIKRGENIKSVFLSSQKYNQAKLEIVRLIGN